MFGVSHFMCEMLDPEFSFFTLNERIDKLAILTEKKIKYPNPSLKSQKDLAAQNYEAV